MDGHADAGQPSDGPSALLSVPLVVPERAERRAVRWMFGLRAPLWGAAARPFRTCQWIEGEPTRDAAMCGARAVRDTSWCAAHHARVFRDTSASRLAGEIAHDPHREFGAAARALRWRKFSR